MTHLDAGPVHRYECNLSENICANYVSVVLHLERGLTEHPSSFRASGCETVSHLVTCRTRGLARHKQTQVSLSPFSFLFFSRLTSVPGTHREWELTLKTTTSQISDLSPGRPSGSQHTLAFHHLKREFLTGTFITLGRKLLQQTVLSLKIEKLKL